MTQPRNVDLIRALLAARQRRGAVILSAFSAPVLALQEVPAPQASPQASPLTERELAALLSGLLPGILAGVEQARLSFGDRRLTLAEASALATTVIGIVSAAVRDGAPLIQGTSARDLVLLIYGVLFDRYVTPLLPLWLRPLAPVIKAGAVRALEGLYQAVIRRRG